MRPFSVVVPAVAASIHSLLGVPDNDARCDEVGLQAGSANVASVFVGNSALQPLELVASSSTIMPIKNVKTVYVKGNGTDLLTVLLFD